MRIEVLGPGCALCDKLHANVLAAVASAGLSAEVRKVEAFDEIVKAGVLRTPALVVDGAVRAVGKVLSVPELLELLGRE